MYKPYLSTNVPVEALKYVNNLLLKADFGSHFVLDIALVNSSFKCIELNNINTSGLYLSNHEILIDSLLSI